MVDERPRVGAADSANAIERSAKYRAGIDRRDVAAREYKRADFRRVECKSFKLAIADALVARQSDPVIPAAFTKPDFIGQAALLESLGVAHDGGTRIAQRGDDREAVQRLVEKKGERVRLL